MSRAVAKKIHEVTNLTFWGENPEWNLGNPALKLVCSALRKLPFSLYETEKKLFFDENKILAINGESVVVPNGDSLVDKFMFRYPKNASLEAFRQDVDYETKKVVTFLAGIALPTEVGIKQANFFKRPAIHPLAVTQTQQKLDLLANPTLDVSLVAEEATTHLRTYKTLSDLEELILGSEALAAEYGYWPDIAQNSGNLRRNLVDGSVTLIDVMPVYESGQRLIGDGAYILPETLATLDNFRELVGQYGA